MAYNNYKRVEVMLNISPVIKVSLFMASICLFLFISAEQFGLNDQYEKSEAHLRVKNSKSIAMLVSLSIARQDMFGMSKVLRIILDSNSDMEKIVVEYKNKNILDITRTDSLSGGDKVEYRVPLFSSNKNVGYVSFTYLPIAKYNLFGFELNETLVVPLYLFIFMFFFSWIFLGNILKAIDPSSVIPERVGHALDTMVEGIVILDKKNTIMHVNSSFKKIFQFQNDILIGKKINKLKWNIDPQDSIKLPWDIDNTANNVISGKVLKILAHGNISLIISVNCSYIYDENNKIQGTLVSMEDITISEKKNQELISTLKLLRDSEAELKKMNLELKEIADKDPLTGCLNRRAFYKIYVPLVKDYIADPVGKSLSCMMFDIDHFKKVNDTFGHQAGDEAIVTIANILLKLVPDTHSVCRYGGEEFCILIQDDMASSYTIANTIRQEIESYDFDRNPDSLLKGHKLTSSIGLSEFTSNTNSLEELIEFADKALYYAKEHGRNQVVCWKTTNDHGAVLDLGFGDKSQPDIKSS